MIIKNYVYGPVPSRRLGLSLGLNIIPKKTCTLNCIYCQCGRTTKLTLARRSFYPIDEILKEVRTAVAEHRIDYLTFSGEGEPTLNKDIGKLIRLLKAEFKIPVAVITNSTLLFDPKVRHDLYRADLVVPSLDAADQKTFHRINRPHPDLKVEKIVQGLKTFRRYYKGKLLLEIMLVKGVNDSPEHLMKLRRLAYEIKPDRVHLNTVVRPPAEKDALPLTMDDLNQVKLLFGPEAEIAFSPIKTRQRKFHGNRQKAVLAVVQNRPVTEEDLCRSLGIPARDIKPLLKKLVKQGLIKRVAFWGKTFYESR
jgi:wyosine [tRNA(Phe)-imidazoG37] synthetase (radical SAM superfamily)